MDVKRRNFLTGRRSAPPPPRPPWSVDEETFVRDCTRCGDCISRCPTGILMSGDGGFPQVSFQVDGCTLCGECGEVCLPGVIRLKNDNKPWPWVAEVADQCLSLNQVVCRTCSEQCDAGAIRFRLQLGGMATPEIDTELCTGCGTCLAPCPSQSIRLTPLSRSPKVQP